MNYLGNNIDKLPSPGAWDEFIIKREYADKLREMADILDGKIK